MTNYERKFETYQELNPGYKSIVGKCLMTRKLAPSPPSPVIQCLISRAVYSVLGVPSQSLTGTMYKHVNT